MTDWIDLSLTLDNDCMTCGTPWHPKVSIQPMGRLAEVGRNTSKITFGSHSATHLDAPLHFFDGTYGVDEIPLQKLCGEIQVVNFSDKKAGDVVTMADMQGITVTPKMLFAFHWYQNWKTPAYYRDFPYFELPVLEYLVKNGLEMLAMDTPSPDSGSAIGAKDDSPGHKLLLGNRVVIVEYLTNTAQLIPSQRYEIAALPLKLKGSDGSPARVIIRPLG